MRDRRAGADGLQAVVERLYDVALDPVSYEHLLDAWDAERIAMGRGDTAEYRIEQLESHVKRVSAFLERYEQATPEPIARVLKEHAPFLAVALDRDMLIVASNLDAEPPEDRGPKRLADLEFLGPEAAEEVGELAESVFETGQDFIQALSEGATDETGIVLVKLRPAIRANGAAFVVAIFSRTRWNESVEAELRKAFRLSKTEAQIARLVLEMRSRAEIAQIRNRSIETIKRHFSSIFQKTGCRSTGDLVILLMSFINMTSAEGSFSDTEPPGLQSIEIEAGSGRMRRVGYVVAGAPDGAACIHLPGPYCLSRWPETAERAAARSALRIISPIRAGYGPFPAFGGGDLASGTAAEILAIMDRLGIARAPFITQSNDIVFAFRFARKYPERVSAIIACGGAPPLSLPEQYERMDKWHRFILANARYAPRVLPFIVKAGFLLARRIGKKRFLELVYDKAPGDLEVIGNDECLAAIVEGSRFALSDDASAHRAFAETIRYFGRSDWAADVAFAEGRVPVYLVNGSADPMTPPETLREMQQMYPWIEMHIHDGAGEFVFFRHWRDVLRLASRLAEK